MKNETIVHDGECIEPWIQIKILKKKREVSNEIVYRKKKGMTFLRGVGNLKNLVYSFDSYN